MSTRAMFMIGETYRYQPNGGSLKSQFNNKYISQEQRMAAVGRVADVESLGTVAQSTRKLLIPGA